MASHIFFFSYSQGIGVGQGYYSAVTPPGTSGLIAIRSDMGTGPVRLVVTRWGAAPIEADIGSGLKYEVSIDHIQSVGILTISSATATRFVNVVLPG